MEGLITTFHIDWRLMLAQLINFGVVVFVVWHFFLRKLMKTMGDRSATIEQSLEQAKQIEAEVQRTQEQSDKTIVEAKRQAAAILHQADEQARTRQEKIAQETQDKVKTLVTQAKEQIEQQKHSMLEQVKEELADVVAQAAGKILAKKLDSAEDKKFITESLKRQS